jgi:hypothetical protein
MHETTLLNRLVHVTRVGLELLHLAVDAAESSAAATLTEQQLRAAIASAERLSALQRIDVRRASDRAELAGVDAIRRYLA